MGPALIQLQIIQSTIQIEKQLGIPFTDDPYEVFKLNNYTGFTSVYVSDAMKVNVDLVPSVIRLLIDADVKYGTTIEIILSRFSTCLMITLSSEKVT